MKHYYVHVRVPMILTVQAESPEEAKQQILTRKDLAPLDPDGNRIQILGSDITLIQADGE